MDVTTVWAHGLVPTHSEAVQPVDEYDYDAYDYDGNPKTTSTTTAATAPASNSTVRYVLGASIISSMNQ